MKNANIPKKCGTTCTECEWCNYPEWCEVIEKSTPVEIDIRDIAGVGAYSTDDWNPLVDNEWYGYDPVIVKKISDRNYHYEVLEGGGRIYELGRSGWNTVFAIVVEENELM